MNETQYISDFLAPRDAWDKLSIEEQAAMMKTAVSEGILDLDTIRQKYNEFAEGGDTGNKLPIGGPISIGTTARGAVKATKQRLYENLSPIGYDDLSRVPKAILFNEPDRYHDAMKDMPVLDEIYAQYLGIPEEDRHFNQRLEKSTYKPTMGGEDVVYYKLPQTKVDGRTILGDNNRYNGFSNTAVDTMVLDATYMEPNTNKQQLNTELGYYTVGRGRDERGDYVSYYDKWDINPFKGGLSNKSALPKDAKHVLSNISMDFGTPVHIYDRIYFDDYYGIKGDARGGHYLPEVIVTGKKHSIGGPLVEAAINEYRNGGSIHISPSKRGTFTAAAKKHGKSVQAFASQVLAHPENYSPAMRKKANFARNARKWKHGLGGNLFGGTTEDSQKMQIGLKATNGWKPYTLDDVLANAARIEQQKQAMEDRLNNVFTLSNDATSVANGRPQNRHLERKAVEGAKAHAAWEKEHPVLNTIGTALGASPFAVAATPLLAAAGEAAAPVLTNPYVDAALTSGFGTHGLNHAINEGIDGWGDAAMTTLEVTPLGRFAVPITSKIMGNIADQSMNILRGDSPVEFVGTLYNYARRKPISFAEKQAAANRMETFIHSPEYIERQKAAGLSDSEIADFQSMVSRRLNGGNFPAYTMKRKTNGLSLTLPKPFGGIYMKEGIPYSDFLNSFDHEVAHYSTVNFGKTDNQLLKWVNRENPTVTEKAIEYNVNKVPYRPETDASKVRTARGLDPYTDKLDYFRDEQETRSNAYAVLQEAKRRGITVDDLVDQYTMQSTGEIFGFAPAPLRYLNYAYTPENIKKFTKGFLSFAAPLTLGINYINQDAE